MIIKGSHENSVRYLIPSTKKSLEKYRKDSAYAELCAFMSDCENRPMLDTLNEITRSPEEMRRRSPTLVHDSGWKSATGTEDVSND